MRFIKYTLFFLVSWGCSIVFFDSSLMVTILLSSFLLYLSSDKHNVIPIFDKKQKLAYIVLMLIGFIMIIINEMFIQYDWLTIIGAVIFSVSFSTWITKKINWDAIKVRIKENKNK